jgi:hypothetical protein
MFILGNNDTAAVIAINLKRTQENLLIWIQKKTIYLQPFSLKDLSRIFNPVLQGWSNYYGRFHRSALNPLWWNVNVYLVRWLQHKYKHLKRSSKRAVQVLEQMALKSPESFVHWMLGICPRKAR